MSTTSTPVQLARAQSRASTGLGPVSPEASSRCPLPPEGRAIQDDAPIGDHDEHILQDAGILERVALEDDQIGFVPLDHASGARADPEELGGPTRRRRERLDR